MRSAHSCLPDDSLTLPRVPPPIAIEAPGRVPRTAASSDRRPVSV